MKKQHSIIQLSKTIFCFGLLALVFSLSTGCEKDTSVQAPVANETELPPLLDQGEGETENCGVSVVEGGGNVALVHTQAEIDHLKYWNEHTQQMEWICAPAYYGHNVPPCEVGGEYLIEQNPSGNYGLSIGSEGENTFCQTTSVNCDYTETVCQDETFVVWLGDLVLVEIWAGDYAPGYANIVGPQWAAAAGVTELLGGEYLLYHPPAGFVGQVSITILYRDQYNVPISEVTYCIDVIEC